MHVVIGVQADKYVTAHEHKFRVPATTKDLWRLSHLPEEPVCDKHGQPILKEMEFSYMTLQGKNYRRYTGKEDVVLAVEFESISFYDYLNEKGLIIGTCYRDNTEIHDTDVLGMDITGVYDGAAKSFTQLEFKRLFREARRLLKQVGIDEPPQIHFGLRWRAD